MNPLTPYETEYIGFLGDFFELSYLSKTEGMIFGIIVLRALTVDTGLSQEEIAELSGKSKTTISRTLDSLIKLGFCTYILEESEIQLNTKKGEAKLGRAKRKYYFHSGFREISKASLQQRITKLEELKTKLQKFIEGVPTSESSEHQGLVRSSDHFKNSLENWIKAYQKMMTVFQNP